MMRFSRLISGLGVAGGFGVPALVLCFLASAGVFYWRGWAAGESAYVARQIAAKIEQQEITISLLTEEARTAEEDDRKLGAFYEALQGWQSDNCIIDGSTLERLRHPFSSP